MDIGRRFRSCKRLELLDEVRLVVVAALERDSHPIGPGAFALDHSQSTLKPNDSAQSLGWQADPGIESSVQFPEADSHLFCKALDRQTAAAAEDEVDCS